MNTHLETVSAVASNVATGITVTAANQQVTVTFTQPTLTPDDLTPTTETRLGYTIKVYKDGLLQGVNDSCVDNSNSASESCVVSEYTPLAGGTAQLVNGTAYTFKVIARWSDGVQETNSTESAASESATPYTTPAKPDAPTAVVKNGTPTSADISWVAPDNNGESIDLYTVTVWNKAGTTAITSNSGCTSTSLTCVVTNLTLGNAYTFKVKANNSAGDSPVSDASATYTVAPSVPENVKAELKIVSGVASVDVSWDAPTSNVESISEYTVKATSTSAGSATKTWTTGSLTVNFTADAAGADLTLGVSYAVTVKAKNAGGYGAESAEKTVIPSTVPGAPSNVGATFSGTTATVTWGIPATDGGEAVSEYTAAVFPSTAADTSGTPVSTCTSTSSLQCAISGLAASTNYKFAVKAKNPTGGYGAFSVLSAVVTSGVAIVAPDAPSNVGATFSGTTATVTWAAPNSNGGEAVSEYTAAVFPSTASNTNGTPIGTCTSTSALQCSISNLTANTSYKFAVKAKNPTGGYGAFSSLSAAVTSPAPPAPPAEQTPTPVAPASGNTPSNTSTNSSSSANNSSSSSLPGQSVALSRSPSSAISTRTEVAILDKKISLLLGVPTASKAASQVTSYIIELKPAKGSVVRKTVKVKPGQVVTPSLTGKSKTTYTLSVTSVTKSGKKSTWRGPKIVIK